MVVPGPGEVQLLGYNPDLPPAPPELSSINEEAEQDLRNSPVTNEELNIPVTESDPNGLTVNSYLVTLTFVVKAIDPVRAQISAGDQGPPMSSSAQLVDE